MFDLGLALDLGLTGSGFLGVRVSWLGTDFCDPGWYAYGFSNAYLGGSVSRVEFLPYGCDCTVNSDKYIAITDRTAWIQNSGPTRWNSVNTDYLQQIRVLWINGCLSSRGAIVATMVGPQLNSRRADSRHDYKASRIDAPLNKAFHKHIFIRNCRCPGR